jgi:hypothetical protein
MPDSFGNPTPQEVQQAILQQQQTKLTNAFNSQGSGFGKAGVGLGNALGGLFRKNTVDPRVEKAAAIQEGVAIGQRTYDQLQDKIGHERARAAQMTVTAAQMRRLGFSQEANNITLQAIDEKRTEELRQLGLEQLRADIANTRSQIEDRGESETTRLADDLEEKTALIETTEDPVERAQLMQQKEYLLGRMTMLTTRSLSDADFQQLTGSGINKINLDILDDKLLDERFGMLEQQVMNFQGDWAATTIGNVGATIASGLEGFAGVPPGTWGADDLVADVTEFKSFPAYASSQLRHALTGAAMSAQEQPLMEPFLPTPGDSPSVMLGKIRAVRAYTQLDIATRQAFLDQHLASDNAGNRFPTADQVPPGVVTMMNALQKSHTGASKVTNTKDDDAISSTLSLVDQEIARRQGASTDER